MPLFVVSRLQVDPSQLAEVLALIRGEFARDLRRPGRRQARVFQRLGSPTDLLGLVEWDGEESYDAYRRSSTHRALLNGLSAPAHTRSCARLSLFEYFLQPTAVSACAIITPGLAPSTVIEEVIRQQGQADVIPSPGLVGHELYRTLEHPPIYVVMHRWRDFADLDRFRRDISPRLQRTLADLGATLERFTGQLVAEFPARDS
jgi:heme-degrading monooxygenase HmoA